MEKLPIIGNATPEIGVLQDYTILEQNTFMLPQYRSEQEALVWDIYVLEKNGWRKTNGNTKVGKQVSYTFTQRSLSRKGIKIVVEQKGKKGELVIKPQPAKKPKILKVELLDINGNKVDKPLSYMDTLVAKAHCADMEGEQVYFTLWEDDAVGKGHHPDNEVNKINPIAIPSIVKKGVAEMRFPMARYYLASKIANIQAPKGSKDEGAHHEYYVTVEYRGKSTNQNKASNNVNLKNPEYQKGVEISNKNMGAKLLNERVSSKIVKIIETEQHIKIETGRSMSKVSQEKKENNTEKDESSAVVVLTGEIMRKGKASKHRGDYYMYKVKIYNDISYDNYLKNKEKLIPSCTHELSRDAWNPSKLRSTERYGSKNETPPGVYWITYYPKGIGSKKYNIKVSDTKKGDYINGIHGKRDGIRIHHFSPHFSEGCITTGDNDKSSVMEFINKVPALKKNSIRLIIEERKVEYKDNLYKGTK